VSVSVSGAWASLEPAESALTRSAGLSLSRRAAAPCGLPVRAELAHAACRHVYVYGAHAHTRVGRCRPRDHPFLCGGRRGGGRRGRAGLRGSHGVGRRRCDTRAPMHRHAHTRGVSRTTYTHTHGPPRRPACPLPGEDAAAAQWLVEALLAPAPAPDPQPARLTPRLMACAARTGCTTLLARLREVGTRPHPDPTPTTACSQPLSLALWLSLRGPVTAPTTGTHARPAKPLALAPPSAPPATAKMGCGWDEGVWAGAVEGGCSQALVWLARQGCPRPVRLALLLQSQAVVAKQAQSYDYVSKPGPQAGPAGLPAACEAT
jgi:hypothetical protein